MNPEIMLQIAAQQAQDRRDQADRNRIARTLARALRGGQRRTVESDGFVAPAIPDYVDGSFHGASEAASPVPAARSAA
jgi:hypothetical protein